MGKAGKSLVVMNLVLAIALLTASLPGCGRTLSRWGLGSQKITAPKGAQQVLGVSFHSSGSSTIKDVLFVMNDCTVIAKEYKDISPFEGDLRIMDSEGKPFRQAGCVPAAEGR